MRCVGTASLRVAEAEMPVQLALDLDQNVFLASYPIGAAGSLREGAKLDWFTASLSLLNLELSLPTGTLRKERYDDFFVVHDCPGRQSIFDSEATRALNLRGGEEGIATLTLAPRFSRVRFSYRPYHDESPSEQEIFYSGCVVSSGPPERYELRGVPFALAGDKGGLVLRAEKYAAGIEGPFRFCWSVVQGAPLLTRCILDGTEITLNLASAGTRSSTSRLYEHYRELPQFLRAAFRFCDSLDDRAFAKFTRASHFYLQGVSGGGAIDLKTIDLFVFLEMLDETDTLTKQGVSGLLRCDQNDGDLICRVRNSLVHKGLPLGEAVLSRHREIVSHTGTWQSVFELFPSDAWATACYFHHRLGGLAARYWGRVLGLQLEVNDHGATLRSIARRAASPETREPNRLAGG